VARIEVSVHSSDHLVAIPSWLGRMAGIEKRQPATFYVTGRGKYESGEGRTCLGKIRAALLADTVFAAKLVNPTTGINNLLLSGIKRMAGRADFNIEVVT